jgi:hypothetical protein
VVFIGESFRLWNTESAIDTARVDTNFTTADKVVY